MSKRVESITFNGITFRRYPDSPKSAHRNYYWPSGNYRKRGTGALHVEIWRASYGAIPDGYLVHHRDGNPLNNEVDNLQLVTHREHAAIHWQDPDRLERGRQHMERIMLGLSSELMKFWK